PAVVRELRFGRHSVSWPPCGARGRFRPCGSPDGALQGSACRAHASACEFCEENVMPGGNGRRVAVVAGCRTPFCKSGTALKDARAVDLARYVARELLERTNLDGPDVDEVVFGQVVPSALVPNVGREVSLLPQFPKPSTGETMGQSAEKMAKENHITRAAQDQWALRSHQRAAQGTDDGRLTAEIVPWLPARLPEPVVTQDNGIRRDTTLEQMAKL